MMMFCGLVGSSWMLNSACCFRIGSAFLACSSNCSGLSSRTSPYLLFSCFLRLAISWRRSEVVCVVILAAINYVKDYTDSFLATKKAATTCAAKQTVHNPPTMLKSRFKVTAFSIVEKVCNLIVGCVFRCLLGTFKNKKKSHFFNGKFWGF